MKFEFDGKKLGKILQQPTFSDDELEYAILGLREALAFLETTGNHAITHYYRITLSQLEGYRHHRIYLDKDKAK